MWHRVSEVFSQAAQANPAGSGDDDDDDDGNAKEEREREFVKFARKCSLISTFSATVKKTLGIRDGALRKREREKEREKENERGST